ncbi:RagB/SusD family nutrient uptake outer membrane protein [Maribellus mangrovi]|uniref:RagB/SusD family nutrient uptake outer membrane protein n=1 Tax=Maribellus mangrovi TaxID=3133146 RepID=UPI0030EF1B83
MKKIFIYLFIGFMAFGCTDVLDKYPLDEITEDSYWKTSTDMELYLNQFYTKFRKLTAGWSLGVYESETNSDNMQPATPNSTLNGQRSVPASGGGWSWGDIRKINYFIENAENVTDGLEADIKHYKGEGRFFRAMFYFSKVSSFGAVPWYDKVLNIESEELYAPRIPRDQIVDKIIEDLDVAIDLMKEKSEVPEHRLHRGIALLLKARVCLFEGTWEKYHEGTEFGVQGSDGTKYLQLAVAATEELMQGPYGIYSTGDTENDYWKLFNRIDHSSTAEVMMWQECNPELGTGHGAQQYLNGMGGNQSGITKQLVDQYLCADGLPISLSPMYKGDSTLLQTVEGRDPRLTQSVWVPGQLQSDAGIYFQYPTIAESAAQNSTTGYMVRKGSTTDASQQQSGGTSDYAKTAGIVYRYAEALLIFAEAKAELGTLSQTDLDNSINLLRARAGMPALDLNVGFTDPNWEFPNLSPIINEIRRERRVELALEGFRLEDLRRWRAHDIFKGKRLKGARFIQGVSFPEIENLLGGVLVDDDRYIDRDKVTMPNGYGFVVNRDYLSPIPTNELTLNPNLVQNPGWE